jgi:hypothetical protein
MLVFRAGLVQSGDRISVGRDVPHPSKPALVSNQLPVQWVPDIFPVVKAAGRGVDHPPRSSAVVKERVELYHYYQAEPSWHVSGCGSCSVVDTKVVCSCFEPTVWVGCAAVQIMRFSG